MPDLNSIIQVNITRSTQAVSRASFSIPCFVAELTEFPERAREYTSITAVAADFASTSNVYKAAAALFGQEIKPPKIVIGRKVPTSETWVEAIRSVMMENNEWYALAIASRAPADVLAVAELIEGLPKIFGTSTSDANALTAATTDIGSDLKDLGFFRTFVVYNEDASTTYPECAFIGRCLPEVPGSNTWKFKTLSGVRSSNLTETQASNLRSKNINLIETIGGVKITSEGVTSGGEFIDVMILVDWTAARIRERIYFRLVNTNKIPYTKAGLSIIQAEILTVLDEGVQNGGYTDNPRPVVNIPNPLTIDANLRAQRMVEGVKFKASLAGALHFVSVEGNVSV